MGHCIDSPSGEKVHEFYDPKKCQLKKLYTKIYESCNCILRYIDDIGEFFDDYDFKNYSSCTLLQHTECAAPIVIGWDWTISHDCPESCSSRYFTQNDIQYISFP